MRDQIKALLLKVEPGQSINRHDVAKALGARPGKDGGAFAREWDRARKEAIGDGVILVSHRRGGAYERKAGDEGAKAALSRSAELARKGLRCIGHGQRLALEAPKMTSDQHLVAALERQADRTELMLATVGALQRQRKF